MVRLKNRYLLCNILYPGQTASSATPVPDLVLLNQPTTDDLTPNLLVRAIRAQVADLFGDYGAGAIADSLTVKYLSPATSTFIIRVSRAHYTLAWAALSFINHVPVKNGKACVFRVVRVSGTIRKAEQEAIKQAREMVIRARRETELHGALALEDILGEARPPAETDQHKDVLMLDASDSEDGALTDGDG